MKNNVGIGAIVLIVSGFICKIFGALFRLPLTNILGIAGIGVFQMVMSLYSLMLVLTTGGVTTALSRLVSLARARGERSKIKSYLRVAFLFSFGLSACVGLFFFIFARNIASVQGVPDGISSYRLLLLLLPMGALIGTFRGIIQGYENMTPTAVSQIIEQIVKFAFGILFALWLGKNGVAQGVFGAFLGITVSELIATFYLGLFMLRKVHMEKEKPVPVWYDFLHAAIPLSIGGAVIPCTHAIDSLMIVSRLAVAGFAAENATALFGLQTGVVGAILNFPLIISLAIAMAMLPKISYLSGKGAKKEQQKVISLAFSVMWLFLLPLVIGLMSLSRLVYPIIYPSAIHGYLNVAIGLTLVGGFSIILSAIMQFLLSILQANGFYGFSMVATAIGGGVKVLLVFFLAALPEIGIYAIPISNISLCLIVCLLALIKLGRLVQVNYFHVLIPLMSGIVMYFVLYLLLQSVTLPSIWLLVIAIVLGAFVYLILNIPVIYSLIHAFLGNYQGRRRHE